MSLKVLKFPDIQLSGRPVFWDTRQFEGAKTNSKPLFVLPSLSDPSRHNILEFIKQLKNKYEFETVGNNGEDCDIAVGDSGRYLSEISAAHYAYPSKKLKVIGVTGTNGKTSTCSMLRHLLVHAGKSVCELGTLGLRLWNPSQKDQPVLNLETGFTTPVGPTLQNLFSQLIKMQCEYVVMEVSSHSCSLGRIGGTWFEGLVFTNLTPDHLDFHGDMLSYENSKKSFFTDYAVSPLRVLDSQVRHAPTLGAVIVSSETSADTSGRIFQGISNYKKSIVSLSDVKVLEKSIYGTRLELFENLEPVFLPVLGDYQVENFLGAATLLREGGIPCQSISSFTGISGRMELVKSTDGKVFFVDYAHTPDALKKSLQTLSALKSKNQKLFVVMGCGGDRDKLKRPQMGKIAGELADFVIITNDNPRTENPRDIVSQIEAGISEKSKVHIELDREKAIGLARKNMSALDICLVAGKGHEQYQIVGDQKLSFSDQKVILSS
jgi:UDP-N-acetylmuramoyl-L-alanyl-D-glutamate--2,6-diaminopimelate ligase